MPRKLWVKCILCILNVFRIHLQSILSILEYSAESILYSEYNSLNFNVFSILAEYKYNVFVTSLIVTNIMDIIRYYHSGEFVQLATALATTEVVQPRRYL